VNAVSLTTRLLMEFGLCECPLQGGLKPGRLDLTRLMAKAASLPGYGGWSDAIRWDAIEPVLKIRPLGDIHAKAADFEEIVANFGRAGSDLRVADAGENYPRNLEDIGVRESLETEFDTAFLAAWSEEFGASFDDMRRFIDALEDMGIQANQQVLRLPKSELASLTLGGKTLPPEPTSAIVEALLFKPRSRWRETPGGYDDKDRQPWRFRRRLSVLRKPLIQIDESADPIILVAPGLLRSGFGYMAGGFLRGDFPVWQLKPLMRSWRGRRATGAVSTSTVKSPRVSETADGRPSRRWRLRSCLARGSTVTTAMSTSLRGVPKAAGCSLSFHASRSWEAIWYLNIRSQCNSP